MNNSIALIEKSSKQNIWLIKEGYPFYAHKKNLYGYDFAVMAIREKGERLHRYCSTMGDPHIAIACQRNGQSYDLLISDLSCGENIPIGRVDSVFIYFEKSSQALLAFTTAQTFAATGFFINSVASSDIPSLREEAMSIAYMMDKSVFNLFNRHNGAEGGYDLNERAE